MKSNKGYDHFKDEKPFVVLETLYVLIHIC